MNRLARIPASEFPEQVFRANKAPIFSAQIGHFSGAFSHISALARTIVCTIVFLLVSGAAMAQSPTIALSVGFPTPVTSLSFGLISGPDVASTVAASPSSFNVQVVTTNTTTWTLQVSASQAYLDPSTRLIPVGNISWTASGTGFIDGTLGISTQTVASGSGSGTFTGSMSFVMLNRWTYPTGIYSDTITYTATAI